MYGHNTLWMLLAQRPSAGWYATGKPPVAAHLPYLCKRLSGIHQRHTQSIAICRRYGNMDCRLYQSLRHLNARKLMQEMAGEAKRREIKPHLHFEKQGEKQ